MLRSTSVKAALTSFALLACFSAGLVQAGGTGEIRAAVAISATELSQQALQTYRLIHQGGPFAYTKDGAVFGNRERLLPTQKRGYYLEYTVATPGSRDRGARRIVCGGAPKTPDACYYTDDHYASFRRIEP